MEIEHQPLSAAVAEDDDACVAEAEDGHHETEGETEGETAGDMDSSSERKGQGNGEIW